jgi:hypothetical protein
VLSVYDDNSRGQSGLIAGFFWKGLVGSRILTSVTPLIRRPRIPEATRAAARYRAPAGNRLGRVRPRQAGRRKIEVKELPQ